MRWKDAISGSVAYLQHLWMGRPDYAIFFGYGVGDDLLCTTLAHEMKKRGVRKIVMFSKYPELYEGNPDVMGTYDLGYPTLGRRRYWGYGTMVPQYASYDPVTDRDINQPFHFLQTMCQYEGVQGEIDLRPYIYLRDAEKTNGQFFPKQAVIHAGGRKDAKNKEWGAERYQEVADRFEDKLSWIQLGAAEDPLIQGALDMRGKTTLRESAAIMANAQVFLGQAGFLMHLARAVETRAVIVYGGREDPVISGYRCFDNLVGRTPCSFCWQRTKCDFNHECMRMITVDEVAASVDRQLGLVGTPLVLERVMVPPSQKPNLIV